MKFLVCFWNFFGYILLCYKDYYLAVKAAKLSNGWKINVASIIDSEITLSDTNRIHYRSIANDKLVGYHLNFLPRTKSLSFLAISEMEYEKNLGKFLDRKKSFNVIIPLTTDHDNSS